MVLRVFDHNFCVLSNSTIEVAPWNPHKYSLKLRCWRGNVHGNFNMEVSTWNSLSRCFKCWVMWRTDQRSFRKHITFLDKPTNTETPLSFPRNNKNRPIHQSQVPTSPLTKSTSFMGQKKSSLEVRDFKHYHPLMKPLRGNSPSKLPSKF